MEEGNDLKYDSSVFNVDSDDDSRDEELLLSSFDADVVGCVLC